MALSRTRHWKQHWDADADYIFLRRLRMDGGSIPNFVLPGDPVTEEIKQKLGMARVRRWWDNETIGLANFDPTQRSRRTALVMESVEKNGGVALIEPELVVNGDAVRASVQVELPAPASTGGFEHTGGGWYTITFEDGSTERIRGKAKAEAALAARVNATVEG
jgi:hypothetical protein